MSSSTDLAGGTTQLGDRTITRMGYGAMQLAGKGVFGPPRDRTEAIRVLRTAVDMGITHIDTSDFYGPHVTNEIIREALHPYPEDVVIVTKVGAKRDETGGWLGASSPEELVSAVHDNLRNLGLEALDVVNLRLHSHDGPFEGAVKPLYAVLAELREQGLIRELGISNATSDQVTEAQTVAPVVTVQNLYNLANRDDDALIDRCAAEGIVYAPFFPLGGFTPLQSDTLESVAQRLGSSPQQVALAWLLQRSPAIALIPGTSSVAHLHDNVASASLELDADTVRELDGIGA